MAQVINTNVASLNAQRNLNTSQTSLATALQRLSSGLRINSAKDDAAGLAISDRFTTQIRGLNQAVRNSNDGISMSQTGEGALAEVNTNLQRIRELAVQAVNVTNSASDRAAINLEVQQRLAEIDRTAAQTSFNGQKILNGEIGNATFQVGANVGETISVGFSTSVRITEIGAAATASSGVALSSLLSAGTPAVAGSYTKAAVADFDFSNTAAVASTYTSGVIAPGNYSTIAATQATYASDLVAPGDYRTVAATASSYRSNVIGAYNAGDVFTLTGSTGPALTVTTVGASNNATDLLAEITGSAGYAASGITAALGAGADAGRIIITSEVAGAGTVTVGGAQAALISGGAGAGATAGTNINTSANKVFTVDTAAGVPTTVTIDALITDAASFVAAIGAQLTGSGATAAAGTGGNAGRVVFTATNAGAGNVTIGGANAALITTNAIDTAGANVNTANNKTFTLQGTAGTLTTITLDDVITDAASMKVAIDAHLGASGVTTAVSGGAIVFTSATAGPGAVTIGGANAALFTAGGTAVAGAAASDKRANFTVDGVAVALTTNLTNQAGLVAEIQADLNAGAAGIYTVAASGAAGFSITTAIPGATNPAVVAGWGGRGLADLGGGTAVAGSDAVAAATLALAAGDLSFQVGTGSAIAITGTFTSGTQLVNAINSNVQGLNASINAGTGMLDLSSSQDITVAGTRGLAGAGNLQYVATPYVAAGDLSTGNTLTVAASNDLIQRVDSALSTVSTLRSTFGAVQNRFESTIANLMGTAENLTAARSRILDADFAAETASLTRNQILQQAGIAMLSQANALPNNVLSLLRG